MKDFVDQSPLEKSLRKPLDFLLEFRKFWKTREAIKAGVPLYDLTPLQRSKEGLLGPWSLNIQESVFAVLPAILIVQVMDFLFGKPQITPGFDNLDRQAQVFMEIATSTDQFFSTFFVPVLITIFVFLIGWGSLKRKDSNKKARAKARRVYLYLDGAYGLFSQCTLAITSSLYVWFLARPEIKVPTVLIVVWGILVAFGGFTQWYHTFNNIPKKLFRANGYSGRSKWFWQKKLVDDPPWGKYKLAVFIGGWPCFLIIWAVLTSLSWLTAWCLTALKLLIVG